MGNKIIVRAVLIAWASRCRARRPAHGAAAGDRSRSSTRSSSPPLCAAPRPSTCRRASPCSIEQTLHDAGRSNFEDVLGLIPNLNWAGDTSLPRYFQLRGIGELEQYQGAPNPSVGFLIDDIDFSGLGTAGTLFDLDQIDVLRGPQAPATGRTRSQDSSTCAAPSPLIPSTAASISTAATTARISEGAVRQRAGRFAGFGLSVGRPALLQQRLLSQSVSEPGRHQPAGRIHVSRQVGLSSPSDRLRIELTAMQVNIDNGYDAFAIDNSRNTESDQPGVDSQHSTGISLRAHYLPSDNVGFTAIATYAKSVIKYSYDGDWGNPVLWAPDAAVYQYSEIQNRDRTTKTLELRLGTESSQGFGWLVGIYGNQLDETLIDLSLGDLPAARARRRIPPTIRATASSTVAIGHATSRYSASSTAISPQICAGPWGFAASAGARTIRAPPPTSSAPIPVIPMPLSCRPRSYR